MILCFSACKYPASWLISMFATSFLFIDCGYIIPQDKVFFCNEVTLIKKSGAQKAPDF